MKPSQHLFVYVLLGGLSALPATSAQARLSACAADVQQDAYAAMLQKDQPARERYMHEYLVPSAAQHQERLDQLAAAMLQSDVQNQQQLDTLVAACGWPESLQYTNSNLEAAFLVVQHAPLDYQLKYQSRIAASHADGFLPDHAYRLFEERVATRLKDHAEVPRASDNTESAPRACTEHC